MIPSKIVIGVYLCITLYPSFGGAACQYDPDYEYARKLRSQKYYTDAKPVLQSVIARDPNCMDGKMELALTHFSLGEYDQAEVILLEVRAVAVSIPDPAEAANVLETIDSHLRKIPQLRSSTQQVQQKEQPPLPLQVAIGLGVGDNINGGVHFDALTFDVGGSTFTKVLGDESKAQAGSFTDLEAAYQRELPVSSELEGTFRLMAAMRDNHMGGDFDLGTIRGGLELKPGDLAESLQPSVVLSGGSFFLAGEHYRQDIAVGAQIYPKVFDRKLKFSYQLTDSDYKTVTDTDARYHKVNLSVPLAADKSEQKVGLGLDMSYQWPESTEHLADYHENSVRLRLVMEPAKGYAVSASYGLSQQHDAAAYNTLAFGDKKRNLEQQVLDVGWSWPMGNHLTYEANILARKTDSNVQLFENSSVEATVGARWELD